MSDNRIPHTTKVYQSSGKKMEDILHIWGRIYLTQYGKVTIINCYLNLSEMLSQIKSKEVI